MPFNKILLSVRRWLQHLTGYDQPMYMIVKGETLNDIAHMPMYLECELDMLGTTMVAHRWTRNPARATIFKDIEKRRLDDHPLPDNGFWYPIVELPLYGRPHPKEEP